MMMKLSQTHEKESKPIRDCMIEALINAARSDERVVMLDADLMSAIGGKPFMKEFPDRHINCGVAEANMMGIAAGLSIAGFVPFAHSFGTFATRRAMDQIFISGAYADANVKIIGSDPGITAAYNGGTHMPFEDVGAMRVIPQMTIIEMTDNEMMTCLIPKIKDQYGMTYIRTARKLSYQIYDKENDFTIGKAAKLTDGADAAIFAAGYCVNESLKAAEALKSEGISVSVYDMFTIKPIDKEAIIEAAKKTGAIVTAENHNIIGGLGSAVAEVLSENCPCPMERIGVKDRFGEVGDVPYLADRFELTAPFIIEAVRRAIKRK